MANAYLSMAMTTNVKSVIRRAKALLRLPSDPSGASFLGSTDADAAQSMADCINDALEEFLSDFPILNVAVKDLVTTPGSARTPVPNDLAGAEIIALQWDYEDRRGETITILDPASIAAVDGRFKDGAHQADPPEYVYLEWPQVGDAGHFVWLPAPAYAREFKMLYRAGSVVVTADDVAGDGARVIPVPDSMIECFTHCVAYRLARRDRGNANVEPMTVQAEYMRLVDRWTDKLASTPLQTLHARSGFVGLVSSPNGNQFQDLMGWRQ